MINLILCGGSGTRLWPLSRQAFPKQFVKLINNRSLFQETVTRNDVIFDKFCIVTNRDHYFIAEHQMEEAGITKDRLFILEPVGRNTAPAIALACFSYDPEQIIFVTPSDHLIKNTTSYTERVKTAIDSAEKGKLVTFGIKPEYPETGYGYIEAGEVISDSLFNAKSFREKPDFATAGKYVDSGNYYWNSGMFVFKAGVFLEELKKYSPAIYEKSLYAYNQASKEKDKNAVRISISEKNMKDIPSDSIDYAVMEKSENVYIVASQIGWTDLGSYDAIYDIMEKDEHGNSKNENLIQIKSNNNLVISDDRKLVLIGIDDLIVVDTDDAVLIARKGFSQGVKDVVTMLQKGTAPEKEMTVLHTTVHRPWGTYTILDDTDRYKVKEITVKPGKRLSLQKHTRRSEYWVVVKGDADIQVGDAIYKKKAGESVFIPSGEKHRLANSGSCPVVIIETQTGDYFGEDDIIRIEDDFNRAVEK